MNTVDLLDSAVVHTIGNTARILQLTRRNGEPNRDEVRRLIRTGAIRLVDPSQVVHRWSVSTAEIHRYIESGPRTGADVVPLRGVAS